MIRSIQKVGITLYFLLMLSAGLAFIALSRGIVSLEEAQDVLGIICASPEYSAAFAAMGGIFVIAGIITTYRTLAGIEQKRVIAFQNENGEVVVALSAIEDYIRKTAKEIPGVKNVKPRAFAGKKGIRIVVSASMPADSNIPDMTEALRRTIQLSVESMLGVEAKVDVKLRVNKLIKSHKEEAK